MWLEPFLVRTRQVEGHCHEPRSPSYVTHVVKRSSCNNSSLVAKECGAHKRTNPLSCIYAFCPPVLALYAIIRSLDILVP